MKYAICNELYGDLPFDQVCAHAAKLGYSGIEIAPFTLGRNPVSIDDNERRTIRKTAADAGLEIIGLHWLLARTDGLHVTHPDAEIRKQTAAYFCELAQLCHDLGGSVIVLGSPDQRNLIDGMTHEQGTDHAVEFFRGIAPTLEEQNVTLALEPLGPEETNFMCTAESAIEIARAVDSPFVRLHLDVKAMSTEAKPIPDIVRDSRDWTVHFHANDPNRRGLGMGVVDFMPIFAALDETEYDGWVSVEVFDYAPGIDALAGESIRYMQEIARRTDL